MIEESNKAAWLILISALVAHLLLVSLPSERSPSAGLVRSLIMDMLTPAERLVDRATDGVRSVWSGYFALLETREENERLQKEVDRLRVEIQKNSEAVMEAARLRRLFDLSPFEAGGVVARVTGGAPSVLQRTITLDKGRLAGIEPGSTVRTPDGIVGRVVVASQFSSIVQLVTDPVSAVGAVVQRSRVQGRVRGNGTSELIFEHSEDGVRLVPGEIVVTSGSEGFYPRGLPIGVISGIGSVDDLVSTATVEPAADLGRLEEVLLLPVPIADSSRSEEPTLESRAQP